jgi:serine/threonine-protein phosphatase 2B catalytic subunit
MEPLCDPYLDRQVKSVKPPPHRPLDTPTLYPARLKGKPDHKMLKDHLYREGRISKETLIKLIT